MIVKTKLLGGDVKMINSVLGVVCQTLKIIENVFVRKLVFRQRCVDFSCH